MVVCKGTVSIRACVVKVVRAGHKCVNMYSQCFHHKGHEGTAPHGQAQGYNVSL